MQIPRPLFRPLIPALAIASLFVVAGATAAQTPTPVPAKAQALTNAAPAQPEIPTSVFINPGSPQAGKDPFFPQSTRQQPVINLLTNIAPAVAIAELELKGISGAAGHRLAIINNRTFEAGEEGTVLTNVGRVRLTCREVGENSVRVLLNGVERTLTLRPH
jgi:hypothetical protein